MPKNLVWLLKVSFKVTLVGKLTLTLKVGFMPLQS